MLKFRVTPNGTIWNENNFEEHNQNMNQGGSDDYDEVEITSVGCADVNCPVSKLNDEAPRQGSNAGCRCFDDIYNIHTRVNVRAHLIEIANG